MATKTSRYKGVSRVKCQDGRVAPWRSTISVDDATVHLGLFGDEEAAARMHDAAAYYVHGKACLKRKMNFEYLAEDGRCPLPAEIVAKLTCHVQRTARPARTARAGAAAGERALREAAEAALAGERALREAAEAALAGERALREAAEAALAGERARREAAEAALVERASPVPVPVPVPVDAAIHYNGAELFIGSFGTEEDADAAVDDAAFYMFGKDAALKNLERYPRLPPQETLVLLMAAEQTAARQAQGAQGVRN